MSLQALKKANEEVQEETREFDEDAMEEDDSGIGSLLKQVGPLAHVLKRVGKC